VLGGDACLQRGQGSPRRVVDVGSVVCDGRPWKGQVRVMGMRWSQLCQKIEMWHILLRRSVGEVLSCRRGLGS
jgi:hypothetical protein